MRDEGAQARSKWRGLVSEQVRSGERVKAVCGERGLRAWQFYAWKKRLRNSEGCGFVGVTVPAAGQQEPTGGSHRAIEVRLRVGRSLVVEPGFEADHLPALPAVLRERLLGWKEQLSPKHPMTEADYDIRYAPLAWSVERGKRTKGPLTVPDYRHTPWYAAYAFNSISQYYKDVDYSKLKRGRREYQQFLQELRKADPEAFAPESKPKK